MSRRHHLRGGLSTPERLAIGFCGAVATSVLGGVVLSLYGEQLHEDADTAQQIAQADRLEDVGNDFLTGGLICAIVVGPAIPVIDNLAKRR